MKKYDFQNLTKEGIIEQAQDASKGIFDLGSHTIWRKDKYGRPVLHVKVGNINK